MKKALSLILSALMIASILAAAAIPAGAQTTALITTGSGNWAYGWINTDENLPEGWYAKDFDISAWYHNGKAPFRNSATRVALNGVVRAAILKNVEVADPAAVTALSMDICYGENPVVYINGVEVWSAQGSSEGFVTVDLSEKKDLLVQGLNRVSVYVDNPNGNFYFDMSLTAATADAPVNLIVKGDAWAYGWTWADEQFPAEIFSATFDPAGWPAGYAPFVEYNTVETVLSGVKKAAYFQEIEIADPSAIDYLTMNIFYDENPVLYINGVEAWSAQGYTTTAYATVDLTEKKDLLVAGTNRISVYVENLSGGYCFDMSLLATSKAAPADPAIVPTGASSVGFPMWLCENTEHTIGASDNTNCPFNVLDGNTNTVCGNGYNAGTEQSVTVTLGKAYEVSAVEVYCKNEGAPADILNGGSWGSYDIYAIDGETETKIGSVEAYATGDVLVLDEAVKADAIKVVITSWKGTAWACIADVAVYGVEAEEEQPPVDPDVPIDPDEPVDPPVETGDATAFIAVLAVVALFGAAVVSKKALVK